MRHGLESQRMPNKRLHADAQTYAAFVSFAARKLGTRINFGLARYGYDVTLAASVIVNVCVPRLITWPGKLPRGFATPNLSQFATLGVHEDGKKLLSEGD